ncbi:MAG TPA: MucB/RseB C-terminal domain-containing protein [Burkholderiales bacterium]|nr:MucB/RseB C-terminal domain-containing protein [Burkholderiales bacterium]
MAWLQKIAAASRHVSYAGTFIYHHGNEVETSRIWHIVDADGEHERLATLDGPLREIVRNNENVTCYLPERELVLAEKRTLGQFPALLPPQLLSGITESYVPVKGERDRVAGFSCQVVLLKPKDNLRYGHYFCAELATGLPLRVRTYDSDNEIVESFAFTALSIGNTISKGMLKPHYAAESRNWRVDRAALDQSDAMGDGVLNAPPGFKRLAAIKRSLPGHPAISQIVYSDGIAAVSIFIEPPPASPPAAGPAAHGAINIYVKPEADRMVTVVGEAPPGTIKLIADSLTPEQK